MIDAETVIQLDRVECPGLCNAYPCVSDSLRRQRCSIDEAFVVAPIQGRIEIDLPVTRSVEHVSETGTDRSIA